MNCIGLRDLIGYSAEDVDPYITISVPNIPNIGELLRSVRDHVNANVSKRIDPGNDTGKQQQQSGKKQITPVGLASSSLSSLSNNNRNLSSMRSKSKQQLIEERERMFSQELINTLRSKNGLDSAVLWDQYSEWSNEKISNSDNLDMNPTAASNNNNNNNNNSKKSVRGKNLKSDLSDSKALSLAGGENSGQEHEQVRPIIGVEAHTFGNYVEFDVNLPRDPVYCQSLTIRVFDRKNLTSGGSWFSQASAPVPVATCTISLREFAHTLYGMDMSKRIIDFPISLPQFALTFHGKAMFEKLMRTDSFYTVGTLPSVAAASESGASQQMNSVASSDAAGGGTASINVAAAAATSSEIDIERQETGGENEDAGEEYPETEDIIAIPEGFDDVPPLVAIDMNSLNYNFEEEITEIPVVDNLDLNQVALSDVDADAMYGATWRDGIDEKTLGNSGPQSVEGELELSSIMKEYATYRSLALFRGSEIAGNRTRVGTFKCSIYIEPRDEMSFAIPRNPNFNPFEQLLKAPYPRNNQGVFLSKEAKDEADIITSLSYRPINLKARVYIVQCVGLASSSGINESTHPYVTLGIALPNAAKRSMASEVQYGNALGGVTYINDSSNFKQGLNPFFGTWYDLDVTLPGASVLEVKVFDKTNSIDEEIGTTRIDLEDRWFNPGWQKMAYNGKILREFRSLWNSSTQVPRGKIEMWVEIYTPYDAAEAPITDIRLPQQDEWEIRLVVWGTQKVPPLEDHSSLHMYVSADLTYQTIDGPWVEHHRDTDVHRFIRDGAGNFNWRMKFDFLVPSKFPRLKLMVWNQDFLSADDAMGEANLDLTWLSDLMLSSQNEKIIERPRTFLKLTHTNWPGQNRGSVDIQISAVRKVIAIKDPVGEARDPPNKDPFLPDPYRESWWPSLFGSGSLWRMICCLLIIAIIVIVIVVVVYT